MLVGDKGGSTSKAETSAVLAGAVRELDSVCTGLEMGLGIAWWYVSRCPVSSLGHSREDSGSSCGVVAVIVAIIDEVSENDRGVPA